MNVSQLLVCNNHIFCSISPDLAGCPQLSLWETGQVLRWLSNTFCVQTSMSATRLPAPTAAVRTRWEATAACAATVSGCRTTPAQVRRRMCVCVCAVRVQHTYFFRMCEVWLFFFRCGRVRRRVSVSRPDVREHCGVVSLRFMSSRIHTRQQAVHRCVYQYKEFQSHTHTHVRHGHTVHIQPLSMLPADVNECEAGEPCPGQQCVNTEGSYSCVSCQQGYHTVNGKCAGDVRTCTKYTIAYKTSLSFLSSVFLLSF